MFGHGPIALRVMIGLLIGMAAGCGTEEDNGLEPWKGEARATERLQGRATGADARLGQGESPINEDSRFIDATYAATVFQFGLPLCKGDVNVKVTASFLDNPSLFDIAQGKIDCIKLMQIDLGILMGSLTPKSTGKSSDDAVFVEEGVVKMRDIEGVRTFTPPRPVLPSVFALNPTELATLAVAKTVTARDEATGDQGSGTISLRVMGPRTVYPAPEMGRTFDKAFRWEMTASGFDGLKRMAFFLMDRLEMVWNADPVAIPYIKLETTIEDMLDAMPPVGPDGKVQGIDGLLSGMVAGASGDTFTGRIARGLMGKQKVIIELKLKAMAGLQ